MHQKEQNLRTVTGAPPARDHWQQGTGGWTTPFVDPERLETMLEGLKSLGDRLTSVRFSNHTGLVRSLRGNLFPERPAEEPGARIEIAQEFVSTYGTALLGSEQISFKVEEPPAVGSVVRLRQLGPHEMPVYGAVCCLNFGGGGWLNLVTSSWFPVPPDLEVYDWLEPKEWPEVCAIARRGLEEHQPGLAPALEKEDGESWCAPGDSQTESWVLLPWIDYGQVQYRPGWVVEASLPKAGQAWEMFVDAEWEMVLRRPRPLMVQAPVNGRVFLQNADVPNQETPVGLAVTGSLGAAPDFPLMGDFAEPDQPGDDARRSANVYYHLCQARDAFEEIAATAWGGSSDSPVPMPGTVQPLPVQMLNTPESGRYLSGTSPRLRFGKPDAQGVVIEFENKQVLDPALDCEVIYHEYAHAVQDAVQPDLFDFMPYRFKDALGEGFSFYFGCTLSERPVEGQPRPVGDEPGASLWGEYTYPAGQWLALRDLHREGAANQLPGFDYLQVYGLFPTYAGLAPDPVADEYGCGMLWARTLWDLRRLMGREQADAVILRSLAMLGGVQSELETPAEALLQAAADLAAIHGWPAHERALRLLFRSRGISAATPIRDLVAVEVGAETCLLATGPLGCTLSRDGGQTWTQLGSDGPVPAVALTTLEAAGGVTVWAAGEQWQPGYGGGQVRGGQVYRYDLVANAAGPIDTGQPWTPLPALPETVEILSLLALDGQQAALLAGTERGLFLLDGDWARKAIPPNQKVFDMVLVPWENDERRVLVGTHLSAHVVDPGTWTRDTTQELFSQPLPVPVLAVAAGPATGEMWAGMAGGQLWHWLAGGGAWQPYDAPGGVLYSLLALPAGELVAGTHDGVYHYPSQDGGWEAYNDLAQPGGEALGGVSVLALTTMDGDLLAATAERGIWRHVAGVGWQAAGLGLSAAAWAEAVAPAPARNWSVTLAATLEKGRTASHVLWLPVDYGQLSLQVQAGDVSLRLFAVAPEIDGLQGAGLQTRTLAPGGQFDPVPAGFYLLAVTAKSDTDYTVDANLAP